MVAALSAIASGIAAWRLGGSRNRRVAATAGYAVLSAITVLILFGFGRELVAELSGEIPTMSPRR